MNQNFEQELDMTQSIVDMWNQEMSPKYIAAVLYIPLDQVYDTIESKIKTVE